MVDKSEKQKAVEKILSESDIVWSKYGSDLGTMLE